MIQTAHIKICISGFLTFRTLTHVNLSFVLGAGISTAAGIGDFRGKDGKWTEKDKLKDHGRISLQRPTHPGGGGGGTLIFSYKHRLGPFFWGGS